MNGDVGWRKAPRNLEFYQSVIESNDQDVLTRLPCSLIRKLSL